MSMMIHKTSFILLVFSLLTVTSRAQDYGSGNAMPLFSAHDMLSITLRADFRTILDDVGEVRAEHTGYLEYAGQDDTLVFNVKIMTRGNFRRDPDNCHFPPLRINFIKKQVKGTLFEGMDKIKLVTHCKPNSRAYQQYVLGEYLIYRIFNILTDTSFRVRPAMINYIDEPTGKKSQESFAFFIEPDQVLANRIGAEESKQKYLFQDSTRYNHMSRLAVFQYLVGNTDWAVSTLHNIKLFVTDTARPPYAIPYDFDWSGVVNAYYAKPLPRFELESVSERLFRGYCRTREQFEAQFEYFKSKKKDIYQLYEGFEPLRQRQRKDALKYYDEFYEIIDNDALIRVEFLEKCLREDKF
jgi:hypothetical protein